MGARVEAIVGVSVSQVIAYDVWCARCLSTIRAPLGDALWLSQRQAQRAAEQHQAEHDAADRYPPRR